MTAFHIKALDFIQDEKKKKRATTDFWSPNQDFFFQIWAGTSGIVLYQIRGSDLWPEVALPVCRNVRWAQDPMQLGIPLRSHYFPILFLSPAPKSLKRRRKQHDCKAAKVNPHRHAQRCSRSPLLAEWNNLHQSGRDDDSPDLWPLWKSQENNCSCTHRKNAYAFGGMLCQLHSFAHIWILEHLLVPNNWCPTFNKGRRTAIRRGIYHARSA